MDSVELVQKQNRFKDSLIDFIQSIAIALAFSAFLFIFVITPNEVDGSSMLPNYSSGDRLYTNKLSHWLSGTDIGKTLGLNYERGDVVVVDKPGLGLSLIKRIIGLPGDRLKISDGKVFINGEVLTENYLATGTETFGATFLQDDKEITIPEGKYFVMGDNRKVSNDSRYIGLIEKNWISGKIFLRIWPIEKFGVINSAENN